MGSGGKEQHKYGGLRPPHSLGLESSQRPLSHVFPLSHKTFLSDNCKIKATGANKTLKKIMLYMEQVSKDVANGDGHKVHPVMFPV